MEFYLLFTLIINTMTPFSVTAHSETLGFLVTCIILPLRALLP